MKKLLIFLGLIVFVSVSTYLYFLKKPDDKFIVSMDKDGMNIGVFDKSEDKKMGSWVQNPTVRSTTLEEHILEGIIE